VSQDAGDAGDPGDDADPGSCPARGGESFTAATGVLLANGKTVPISGLKAGDKVKAVNTKTSKTQAETVQAVLVHYDTNLYDLKVKTTHGTEAIDTTSNHLFWDPHLKQWVTAAKLKPGEHLLTANGSPAVADGGHVPVIQDGWMWDLTIQDDHDFYVMPVGSASHEVLNGRTDVIPVLVHNCGPGQAFGTDCTCGGDQSFTRFGTGWESTGRLSRMASEAGNTGKFGYGVSVSTRIVEDSSTATRQEIEDAGFNLKFTPTRNDQMHHTLELPDPVDSAVARTFNRLFGRQR
jgi:hypothetical protein